MNKALLKRIQVYFPNDTEDDILDWYEKSIEYGYPQTLSAYIGYRRVGTLQQDE